ncbi:hypothetical protein [Rhizohabitans arisaemae]|nr:hypothetical protein [Rhizohabitans arisaemae]
MTGTGDDARPVAGRSVRRSGLIVVRAAVVAVFWLLLLLPLLFETG